MKYKTWGKSPGRVNTPHRRKIRYPKVRIRKDVFNKWKRITLICQDTEKELLEEVIKQTELIYANAVYGEVTMVIHNNSVITLLTPASLSRNATQTKGGDLLKGTRIKVTPEAYSRAQTIAKYVGLPMSIVLSIAVSIAVELSDDSVFGLKILKHPSFPP